MQNRTMDYSLYLVTDRKLSLGRSLLEVIKAAVDGGVTVVQLREKEVDSRDFYREALGIKEYLDKRNIPLIINDRLDIALAIDAAGVHLGQEDLPIDVARTILGPGKIIGASVFTPDEAMQAEAMGADYLGLSPIFVTSTKPELMKQLGVEGIGPIRRATRLPLIGIGSMNETNAFSVIRAGLDGVAVVSAICSRPDACAATEKIMQEILRARGRVLPGSSGHGQ
jgi:thiamine-phosphate pyrophosphorylase